MIALFISLTKTKALHRAGESIAVKHSNLNKKY